MNPLHQHIRVAFRYQVHFTSSVFAGANPLLRDVVARDADHLPASLVVVVDRGALSGRAAFTSTIERYCGRHADVLRLSAPVLVVPGGEIVKNEPRYLEEVHRTIHDAALCRHSYVIAVGGGAVLDVVGYAAATAHRGIRLIRIPTTVLSQDDSGVGVKNGINAFGKKNYLGTFAPPCAVINDSSFLCTLSDRDWRSGIAEAVKVAIIKDRRFFDWIEQHVDRLGSRDLGVLERVIRRSAALHVSHIGTSGDPFELGSSRPLDFGHWAAHKLEQLTDYRLRHGEAVAVGMALDSTYACLRGFLGEGDWQRITNLLLALGLPVYAPELTEHLEDEDHPGCVLRGLAEFREHLGGLLTVMLPRAIGEVLDVHEIRVDLVKRGVQILKEIDRARFSRSGVQPAESAMFDRVLASPTCASRGYASKGRLS